MNFQQKWSYLYLSWPFQKYNGAKTHLVQYAEFMLMQFDILKPLNMETNWGKEGAVQSHKRDHQRSSINYPVPLNVSNNPVKNSENSFFTFGTRLKRASFVFSLI